MTGAINDHLGWEYNFYINGGIAIMMAFVWIVLVHNNPQENSRVSNEELIFISENIIQNEEGCEVRKVPPYWAMVKSIKVWALVRFKIMLNV